MESTSNLASVYDNHDPPPPPYEAIAPPYPAATFPEVSSTSDGRVDVQVGSRFSRNVEWLMRRSSTRLPTAAETHDGSRLSRPHPPWNVKLDIVIQVVGSRGDVQPFIALGTELQEHGHRVRLATHATFEHFVSSSGLEFYPLAGNPAELMSYMVRNPGLIPSMKSMLAGDIQKKRATFSQILDGCWRSCIEADPQTQKPFVADAIIANPPSFAHVHCAQALGIPVHLMFTMPWSSTKAFPHPLANLRYSGSDPSLGNLISYHFVEWMTWQGLGDLVNAWRKDALDLEAVPATEGPNLAETLQVPFTYCWSPALVPKPPDWDSHIDVCGFFFREAPSYEAPQELLDFIHAGDPPIYIGFGSVVVEDPENMLSIFLQAVEMAGVRAIISRGWSNFESQGTSNAFLVGDCPHEWLFQRVAAVVHHGGAGTTACGLRYGKPTTIVPFFGDQTFWGNIVAAAGVGPNPIPPNNLTADNLADAIKFCLGASAATAAGHLGRKMNRECGVRAAVESFHAHLPRQQMQCDLLPDQPAVWRVKRGKRKVQLSKAAACALVHGGRLQKKHVKRRETKPIVIDVRRWDPLTAISSASLSTMSGMADATAGIVRDPYQQYRRPSSKTSSEVTPTPDEMPETRDRDARQMALLSATSLGKFLGRASRGVLLDLPLAAAEGMRAVPRLYGEPVKNHSPITDFESGAVAAWSTFTHGLYGGVTDIFVHTYHAKRQQGSLGVAKGLSTGLVSLTMKTGSATMGLFAYPSQGAYRALRKAVRKGPAEKIEEVRWAEGEYLEREVGVDVDRVCEAFEGLLCARA
ncbi:hypothetical protein PHISP_01895 [Aspergillus sp. HF37]|nr:hypothetical protein PHISP_01895 [Aspergillus sp. HF37]